MLYVICPKVFPEILQLDLCLLTTDLFSVSLKTWCLCSEGIVTEVSILQDSLELCGTKSKSTQIKPSLQMLNRL